MRLTIIAYFLSHFYDGNGVRYFLDNFILLFSSKRLFHQWTTLPENKAEAFLDIQITFGNISYVLLEVYGGLSINLANFFMHVLFVNHFAIFANGCNLVVLSRQGGFRFGQ